MRGSKKKAERVGEGFWEEGEIAKFDGMRERRG